MRLCRRVAECRPTTAEGRVDRRHAIHSRDGLGLTSVTNVTDPAIPAATIVVIRDRPSAAPELLMVERAQGMAFAGGAMVFPGGRIDTADQAFAEQLGLGETGAAAVAAIRETLEETAVPVALDPLPSPELARQLQSALVADADFAGLLADADLSPDPAVLVPFARWVPKFHAARRFDTLFFAAPVIGQICLARRVAVCAADLPLDSCRCAGGERVTLPVDRSGTR